MKTSFSIKNTLLGGLILLSITCSVLRGQGIPSSYENIAFLVTFGKEAPVEWGDDDHFSTFFVSLPLHQKEPFFLRIFDPETSGEHDEIKGSFNSTTRFTVYGGRGVYSDPSSRGTEPTGNYLSGTVLRSKVFGNTTDYDGKWYTMGPFNPAEGERTKVGGVEKIIFKIVSVGLSGDDGNLYKYFLTTRPKENITVEGLETFTYEYNFRMEPGISHIYPFISEDVLRIRQHNFDFDGDGYLRIVSVSKKSEMAAMSVDGEWRNSTHEITDDERGKCLDFQVVSLVNRRNNNVVFSIYNQYGEALPFMNAPIGVQEIQNKIKVRQR